MSRSARRVSALKTLTDRRRELYFLHIGKTAGTQIAGLSDQINAQNPTWRVIPCKHGRKLRALPRKNICIHMSKFEPQK